MKTLARVPITPSLKRALERYEQHYADMTEKRERQRQMVDSAAVHLVYQQVRAAKRAREGT